MLNKLNEEAEPAPVPPSSDVELIAAARHIQPRMQPQPLADSNRVDHLFATTDDEYVADSLEPVQPVTSVPLSSMVEAESLRVGLATPAGMMDELLGDIARARLFGPLKEGR